MTSPSHSCLRHLNFCRIPASLLRPASLDVGFDQTVVFLSHRCYENTVMIQGDSVAKGPKLLSIKNYVIEIMTWKWKMKIKKKCKTGPAHNRCWNWSPFTSKHTWMRFSKFWKTFTSLFGASSERIALIYISSNSEELYIYMFVCVCVCVCV